MNATQAADVLGVSARQVYALAAPAGPIPCTRIGKRIIFDMADILEFKQSCRSTATNNTTCAVRNHSATTKNQQLSAASLCTKGQFCPLLSRKLPDPLRPIPRRRIINRRRRCCCPSL